MLETSKTRVIVGGKIIGNVSKFDITYDYKKLHPKAKLELTDGSHINTVLVGIEHVKENSLSKGKETSNWVQYICDEIA